MNQINDRSLSGAPPKCATPSCNNRILSLLEPIPVYCPTCIQRQQEVDPEAMESYSPRIPFRLTGGD